MNSLQATAAVVEALEGLAIPYMLVGAFSSNAYAIPRTTNDADFVVNLASGDLRKIVDRLGTDFRLDPQMRFETITHSVRNVVTYLPTRFEIEFFRLTDDSHHQSRFARRVRKLIGDINREAWIPTGEDVVIQKLRWGRRKDLDDAQNVLAVCWKRLDWDYIHLWTTAHGTLELLNQLCRELPNLSSLDSEFDPSQSP